MCYTFITIFFKMSIKGGGGYLTFFHTEKIALHCQTMNYWRFSKSNKYSNFALDVGPLEPKGAKSDVEFWWLNYNEKQKLSNRKKERQRRLYKHMLGQEAFKNMLISPPHASSRLVFTDRTLTWTSIYLIHLILDFKYVSNGGHEICSNIWCFIANVVEKSRLSFQCISVPPRI